MARVKLLESDVKAILAKIFPSQASVFRLSTDSTLLELTSFARSNNLDSLVIKVDQGVKKRGVVGLVKLNLTVASVYEAAQAWRKLGWSNFIVEGYLPHQEQDEKYLALELVREGWHLSWGEKGGVSVESTWDSVRSALLTSREGKYIFPSWLPPMLHPILDKLINALIEHHLVFLECNPVLIIGDKLIFLDAAGEIDSAGLALPGFPISLTPVTERRNQPVEQQIALLDATTPASLKFRSLNQNGSIWLLLSGGGASLVLADEATDLGYGKELGNYGEYSGAPSDDDTYAYTSLVLTELIRSTAPRKVLIIAGGVANFTDVAKTFSGIIRALKEHEKELVRLGVKVFVRRGGPNEQKGLTMIKAYLAKSSLLGEVSGRDVVLTNVISQAIKYIES
ncbi:MAG: ATP-citrate synthase [Microgenomates group bacterium GW2011_GWF2_47_9]|nr:MAG: ATP-citrate synthase [Microgenomates group bacterium GW2011_GWF2_47_9]